MAPSAMRVRVLIIDDSEGDATQLLDDLRRSGYDPMFERVETAEALRTALTQHTWDVVFMEAALAQLNALEALRLMQGLGLDLPFIVMATATDEAEAVRLLSAGAHAFILKGHPALLGQTLARELRAAEARRQRAESARPAPELWFRVLLEHSPDGPWLLRDDRHRTYAGPSTPGMLGNAGEDVLGADLLTLLHPDDAPAVRALLEGLAQAPFQVVAAEFQVRQSAGEWRWAEATFTNLLALHEVAAIVMNYRDVTERRRGEDRLRLMDEVLQRIQSVVVVMDEMGAVTFVNEAARTLLGYEPAELLGDQWWQAAYEDPSQAMVEREHMAGVAGGQLPPSAPQERAIQTRTGQTRWFLWQAAQGPGHTLIAFGHDVTERKRADAERQLQAAALAAAANAIVIADRRGIISWVNPAFTQLTGYAAEEAVGASTRLLESGYHDQGFYRQMWGTVLAGQVWQGELVNRRKDGRLYDEEQTMTPVLDDNGTVQHVLEIKQDITRRKQAEEQTQTQLRRLSALHNIDLAVTGSLDRNLVLDILLEEALVQLQADAVAILLYDAATHSLEQPVRRGFRTAALQHTHLRIGQGLAGRAALERRPVSIADLSVVPDLLAQAPLLAGEGFVAYQGVPLIAKGQMKGVLEVFHRRPFSPNEDWLNFVSVLAGQAAIAIENAELFANLQRSNDELVTAYDATIEGWSRALDLRDHDTAGHTLRVTELTLRLGRGLGEPETERVHLRRGALLHDIGKLAVPDAILLKPGPLSETEMGLMRQHPTVAYTLLSPIRFLQPALDIPYAHHEKWDGTGYPRGLRGEEIPLAARIFAVADVWDALRSRRPYRPAWPEDRVRAHIQASAGTHFDPKIVAAFLMLEPRP